MTNFTIYLEPDHIFNSKWIRGLGVLFLGIGIYEFINGKDLFIAILHIILGLIWVWGYIIRSLIEKRWGSTRIEFTPNYLLIKNKLYKPEVEIAWEHIKHINCVPNKAEIHLKNPQEVPIEVKLNTYVLNQQLKKTLESFAEQHKIPITA